MLVSTIVQITCFIATALSASCWRDTACSPVTRPSFPGPWDSNIFSPASRSMRPVTVLSANGTFLSSFADLTHINLDELASSLVFDFGVEVGGIIKLDYELVTSKSTSFGLAFSEAKNYIGPGSDSSRGGNGGKPGDGMLLANFTSEGYYALPDERMRGGFRYLTLLLKNPSSDTQVKLKDVWLEISFQPTWSNLRAYHGYFDSSDDLLNKIWYSGAYTVQTNSAPGNTATGPIGNNEQGWRNSKWITDGPTVLLDGAKRDRLVWIGDMGIAVPSAFVSTGDLESTKYALLAIFDNQNADGMFPKAGPPYLQWDSDSYHMWAMIGLYNYFLYSGDVELVEELWPKYEAAVEYAQSLINSDGVVSVKGEADWGRITGSKERCSVSGLLYHALVDGSKMASWLAKDILSGSYAQSAEEIRSAMVQQYWDEKKGAFTDSPKNTSLFPQDCNAIALAYGIVQPESSEAERVSDYLTSNWLEIGPEVPELPGNVSPFLTSIELEGHINALRPDRSIQLIRTLWGWYLNHENGTQSTNPEGFRTDGSWGYRFNKGYTNGPAYMSHAHCWSSGPTSTLSQSIVGLQVTKPAGKEWQLSPASYKEIETMQTGFTTNLGKYSASLTTKNGKTVLEWNTPKDTRGVVRLPGRKAFSVKGGKGKTTT